MFRSKNISDKSLNKGIGEYRRLEEIWLTSILGGVECIL